MILIIDNYDSFTYNLYQMCGVVNADVRVLRNDEASVEAIASLHPSHIVISPGPGRPREAGISADLIARMAGRVPILGICLGHQVLCEAYGADIDHAEKVVHGKTDTIHVAGGSPIFHGLPPVLTVGRYHSLIVRRESLPDDLLVIAETSDGEVMGVKHQDHDTYGLQFHPESFLTCSGQDIMDNFLTMGGRS